MSPKAKMLARRLLRENRGTRNKPPRSWRAIARDDYQNKINYATLNRFALSEGAWLPKTKELREEFLIVLGLKKPRTVKPHSPKMISDMTEKELINAIANRKPMPRIDPRIIKQFVKLKWLKPVRPVRDEQ